MKTTDSEEYGTKNTKNIYCFMSKWKKKITQWNLKLLFLLRVITQAEVKVLSDKATLRCTLSLKKYSNKCIWLNVTKYYLPLDLNRSHAHSIHSVSATVGIFSLLSVDNGEKNWLTVN